MLLDETIAFLRTQPGLASVSIHAGLLPATPDIAMAVYEFGGPSPDLGFGVPGVQYEHPSLQIVCRGVVRDYDGPRDMIQLAYLALATVQAQTLTGTLYLMIRPQQNPFLRERDAKERCVFVCNFSVDKVP